MRRRRNPADRARPFAGVMALLAMGMFAVLVFSLNSMMEAKGSVAWKGVPFRRWLEATDSRSSLMRRERQQRRLEAGEAHEDMNLVVHTFFSPIDPHTRLPTKNLNATDRLMLDTWRAAWESAGWETRILTIEDAQRHPDYESYNKGLDEVPLGANAYYNRLCFLRWLAMATTEGGFMSDYDVLPLITPLTPEEAGPKFAVYGDGVPSLLSGPKEEWERMARLLLTRAQELHKREPEKKLWSDMMALQDLSTPEGENYIKLDQTLDGSVALARRGFSHADCKYFRTSDRRREGGFKVVHFSHHSIENADLQDGESKAFNVRSKLMRSWFEEWNLKCQSVALDLGQIVTAIDEDYKDILGPDTSTSQQEQQEQQEQSVEVMKPKEGFSWERLNEAAASV